MNFYKVCICTDGRYRSFSAFPPYMLMYDLGHVTYPADGTDWILAFSSLKNAAGFASGVPGAVILRCEGEMLDDQHQSSAPLPIGDYIRDFWRGDRQDAITLEGIKAVYLKWVKPVEVVVQRNGKVEHASGAARVFTTPFTAISSAADC